MKSAGVVLLTCTVLGLAECQSGESAQVNTTSDTAIGEPWTYFDVEIDTAIIVELNDPDWDAPPINESTFVAYPVFGRQRAVNTGEVIQWRVRIEPVAEFPDGSREDTFWISVRYVGDEMAFLQDADFTDSMHAVAQGVDGGALRAEVWRADAP